MRFGVVSRFFFEECATTLLGVSARLTDVAVHAIDPGDSMTDVGGSARHRESYRRFSQKQMSTKDLLHVLAIGSIDQHNELHDLLLQLPTVRITALTHFLDLLDVAEQDLVHVAVLFQSLSPLELFEASRTIRQKWPKSKIIVIHEGEEFLEDFLYDQRLFPTAEPQELLGLIELALHEEVGD